MITETEEHEQVIARAWHRKRYTQEEAMMMAEVQGLNYLSVIENFKALQIDEEIEINGN